MDVAMQGKNHDARGVRSDEELLVLAIARCSTSTASHRPKLKLLAYYLLLYILLRPLRGQHISLMKESVTSDSLRSGQQDRGNVITCLSLQPRAALVIWASFLAA